MFYLPLCNHIALLEEQSTVWQISYHCCSWARQSHLCYSRSAGMFEVKQERDS